MKVSEFDLEAFVRYVHEHGGKAGEAAVALVKEIDDLRFALDAIKTELRLAQQEIGQGQPGGVGVAREGGESRRW